MLLRKWGLALLHCIHEIRASKDRISRLAFWYVHCVFLLKAVDPQYPFLLNATEAPLQNVACYDYIVVGGGTTCAWQWRDFWASHRYQDRWFSLRRHQSGSHYCWSSSLCKSWSDHRSSLGQHSARALQRK
jgi:hypothetical protein